MAPSSCLLDPAHLQQEPAQSLSHSQGSVLRHRESPEGSCSLARRSKSLAAIPSTNTQAYHLEDSPSCNTVLQVGSSNTIRMMSEHPRLTDSSHFAILHSPMASLPQHTPCGVLRHDWANSSFKYSIHYKLQGRRHRSLVQRPKSDRDRATQ